MLYGKGEIWAIRCQWWIRGDWNSVWGGVVGEGGDGAKKEERSERRKTERAYFLQMDNGNGDGSTKKVKNMVHLPQKGTEEHKGEGWGPHSGILH